MRQRFSCFALVTIILLMVACTNEHGRSEARLTGSVVEYGRASLGIPLRGVLYMPEGPGPFPVLLYAHGSAPGSLSDEAFEAIAPAFTSRGWAVFAPYRRGQGLSRDAGPFIREEIASARRAGGADRAQAELTRLLDGDHMEDQSKAFVWLARQSFADTRRIAAMGNSFGGIIALLSAERLPICASVNAAGAAESWREAPALRKLMIRAASRAEAPVLFMQARNDFDLLPSRVLAAVMRQAGKPSWIRLYPPFGNTARDAHAFPYRGVEIWAADVHAFLARTCRE